MRVKIKMPRLPFRKGQDRNEQLQRILIPVSCWRNLILVFRQDTVGCYFGDEIELERLKKMTFAEEGEI